MIGTIISGLEVEEDRADVEIEEEAVALAVVAVN